MDKKSENEVYFTPKQAADCFNLSLSTVKNYIYAHKLKTLKTPGGHHRIKKSELLATLGEKIAPKEEADRFFLAQRLCTTLLALFKTLGHTGDSLLKHSRKVSEISGNIARAMDMGESDIKRVEMAGLVHDVGHTCLDKSILLKSGPLTSQEYESVKAHPGIGADILNSVKELAAITDIVAQHHERIDGRGYPKGIKGEAINRLSCIIAVAEAYDSMVSPHSYKKPVSEDIALSELMKHSGSQFDGDIVEVFSRII